MMQSAFPEVMRFLLYVLIVGNLAAFALGALLLLAPQHAALWLRRGDRWISVRQLTKTLDVMHDADALILRYPRVLGALFLVGALFILVEATRFVARLSPAEGGQAMARFFAGGGGPPVVWEWLWLGAVALVYIGAGLAALVGLLALWRADTLRRWSQLANRWTSVRRLTRPIGRPYYGLDHWVSARPRLFGALIMLLAAYSLVVLLWLLRGM